MKFLTRSLLILFLLYGLVYVIGDVCLIRGRAPLWLFLAFPIALIGLQYLVSPWLIGMMFTIGWGYEDDLPAECRQFVERLCAERGLKVPPIGIIQSGTPNAFAYGRIRSDARVVVTSGLIEVLTPSEVNAVLAHEIGHIEHYDFAVMAVASLAPLLLYQIYAWTRRVDQLRAAAWGAYVCYLLSRYVVLLLNRTREYFADHYSAEVTHAPELLASALIKIAYGMIRSDGEFREAMKSKSREERSGYLKNHRIGQTVGIMGISNLNAGQSLALSGVDPAAASAVMRWDVLNPWARIYEMNCTHPLTALRVRELNQQATEFHQHVEYPLPADEPKNWTRFFTEFAVWAAPWVFAVLFVFELFFQRTAWQLGIWVTPETRALLLAAAGACFLVRTAYRYRGVFEDAKVDSLLNDVEASQMKPRAVRLAGEIVGRGLPGAFWSPDLTLRDETGMIFILYRQSIPFARLLFAVKNADDCIGRQVRILGWYRRGLRPYVEMLTLTDEDGKTHRTWSHWVQYALEFAAIAAGLSWWMFLR